MVHVSLGSVSMEKVHYCERFIEFMIDLEVSWPSSVSTSASLGFSLYNKVSMKLKFICYRFHCEQLICIYLIFKCLFDLVMFLLLMLLLFFEWKLKEHFETLNRIKTFHYVYIKIDVYVCGGTCIHTLIYMHTQKIVPVMSRSFGEHVRLLSGDIRRTSSF